MSPSRLWRSAIALAVAFAFVAAGCTTAFRGNSAYTDASDPGAPGKLVNTLWLWQETVTSDGARAAPSLPHNYTIRLGTDGRYEVRADCNRGGGRYRTHRDGTFDLEAPAMTRLACPPGSNESAFLRPLREVARYKFAAEDELWLMLRAGSGTIKLRALPPLPKPRPPQR